MSHRETHVIVGANLTGVRAAEAMRERGFEGQIVLIGAEAELPYHRPPLSKEFLGAAPPDLEQLRIHPESFYAGALIEVRLSTRAVALDASQRTLTLASGERVPFTRALIATGSSVRKLTERGADLPGVLSLRTLADAERLRAALSRANDVVVIGAGLVGLEVAAAARLQGMSSPV